MEDEGDYSPQSMLQNAIEHHLENVNTCLPAIVVRVINDLKGMQIDAQPTINFKGYDGSSVEKPTVLNIPVLFPSSSTSAITFPLNPGDPILLIFSQRGLDAWKAGNGYPTTPTDYRMMDMRDCFAIPSPWPKSRSINDPVRRRWVHNTRDLVVAHNIGSGLEVEMRLTEAGNLIINTDTDVSINANNAAITAQNMVSITAATMSVNVGATSWNGPISQTGNYTQTGVMSSNGVVLDSHIHTGVQSGPGTSGPPAK